MDSTNKYFAEMHNLLRESMQDINPRRSRNMENKPASSTLPRPSSVGNVTIPSSQCSSRDMSSLRQSSPDPLPVRRDLPIHFDKKNKLNGIPRAASSGTPNPRPSTSVRPTRNPFTVHRVTVSRPRPLNHRDDESPPLNSENRLKSTHHLGTSSLIANSTAATFEADCSSQDRSLETRRSSSQIVKESPRTYDKPIYRETETSHLRALKKDPVTDNGSCAGQKDKGVSEKGIDISPSLESDSTVSDGIRILCEWPTSACTCQNQKTKTAAGNPQLSGLMLCSEPSASHNIKTASSSPINRGVRPKEKLTSEYPTYWGLKTNSTTPPPILNSEPSASHEVSTASSSLINRGVRPNEKSAAELINGYPAYWRLQTTPSPILNSVPAPNCGERVRASFSERVNRCPSLDSKFATSHEIRTDSSSLANQGARPKEKLATEYPPNWRLKTTPTPILDSEPASTPETRTDISSAINRGARPKEKPALEYPRYWGLKTTPLPILDSEPSASHEIRSASSSQINCGVPPNEKSALEYPRYWGLKTTPLPILDSEPSASHENRTASSSHINRGVLPNEKSASELINDYPAYWRLQTTPSPILNSVPAPLGGEGLRASISERGNRCSLQNHGNSSFWRRGTIQPATRNAVETGCTCLVYWGPFLCKERCVKHALNNNP